MEGQSSNKGGQKHIFSSDEHRKKPEKMECEVRIPKKLFVLLHLNDLMYSTVKDDIAACHINPACHLLLHTMPQVCAMH